MTSFLNESFFRPMLLFNNHSHLPHRAEARGTDDGDGRKCLAGARTGSTCGRQRSRCSSRSARPSGFRPYRPVQSVRLRCRQFDLKSKQQNFKISSENATSALAYKNNNPFIIVIFCLQLLRHSYNYMAYRITKELG